MSNLILPFLIISPNREEIMKNKVVESWKYIEPEKKLPDDKKSATLLSRNKSEIVPEEAKPKDESDNIYPASSSVTPISFTIKKKPTSSSINFKRRPQEFLDEEERYSNNMRWEPNPELFKPNPTNIFKMTFLPGVEVIDGDIACNLKLPVSLSQSIEFYDITVTYFETIIPDKLKQEFAEKKYKLSPNPNQQDNKLYNNIVIMRLKFRQPKDASLDRQFSNKMIFNVKNQVSGDLLYNFREMLDNKVQLDMKIVDYNILMKASELKKTFEEKNFDNSITNYIEKNKMHFNSAMGIHYSIDGREEEKYRNWSLSILSIIDLR